MRKMVIKKIAAICLIPCILMSFVACGKKSDDKISKGGETQGTTAGLTAKEEFKDGIIGENKRVENELFAKDGVGYEKAEVKGMVSKAEAADDFYGYSESNSANIVAGTLTGGEIRDLKNWDNWLHSYDEKMALSWGLCPDTRIKVYIHNGDEPLNNVKVQLLNGEEVIYQSVTAVDGFAYLFYNYNDKSKQKPSHISVEKSDGTFEKHSINEFKNGEDIMYLDFKSDKVNSDIALDLMFVVDTTGSMGDELDYLKAELQNVIERVHDETGAAIRTSCNFYRDTGDEYEVKYYDFRDDAAQVSKLIADEYADGGGDFPEAVHLALDNAINQHDWSENSTVKLMFLVLDAPPHDEEEVKEKIAAYTLQAAEMGIRIIPVVASGADDVTTQLMRTMAILTGGTYLFLDDNSGIGYSHEIPDDVKDYKSEYLNDMLIRVIGEYCGKEIEKVEIEKTTEEQTSVYVQ